MQLMHVWSYSFTCLFFIFSKSNKVPLFYTFKTFFDHPKLERGAHIVWKQNFDGKLMSNYFISMTDLYYEILELHKKRFWEI